MLWDQIWPRFPGKQKPIRHEDIRPQYPDIDWYPFAPGILLRWKDGQPEMKTTDGQLIESVDIHKDLKNPTKVSNLILKKP